MGVLLGCRVALTAWLGDVEAGDVLSSGVENCKHIMIIYNKAPALMCRPIINLCQRQSDYRKYRPQYNILEYMPSLCNLLYVWAFVQTMHMYCRYIAI